MRKINAGPMCSCTEQHVEREIEAMGLRSPEYAESIKYLIR
jgi:hypothetical protein